MISLSRCVLSKEFPRSEQPLEELVLLRIRRDLIEFFFIDEPHIARAAACLRRQAKIRIVGEECDAFSSAPNFHFLYTLNLHIRNVPPYHVGSISVSSPNGVMSIWTP